LQREHSSDIKCPRLQTCRPFWVWSQQRRYLPGTYQSASTGALQWSAIIRLLQEKRLTPRCKSVHYKSEDPLRCVCNDAPSGNSSSRSRMQRVQKSPVYISTPVC